MATTQATKTNGDGESTREHCFDAIRPGDDVRIDLTRGRRSGFYGTVEHVDRFGAGDVKFAIVDTRSYGPLRFDWHGGVARVDGSVIGRHDGDVLIIDHDTDRVGASDAEVAFALDELERQGSESSD